MASLSKLILAAALVTASGHTFAQQSIQVVDTNYTITNLNLQGFSAVKIQGPYDVYLVQGNEESVKMDGPAEILPRIITEVKGSELNIQNRHDNWGWSEKSWWSDKSWWHTHKRIAVYITAKDINSISTSGSAKVFFNNGIVTDALRLGLSGSGKIEGKINVKSLSSNMSGSGRIMLFGNAQSSDVSISGSGNFAGRGLVTVNSKVHVSGSGHAEVNAGDTVDASVRGSAHVAYIGSAKLVSSSRSGSGVITKM